MFPYRTRFECRLVTPQGQLLNTEAVGVSLPARDGQIGILGGHAPAVIQIGAGGLFVEPAEGPRLTFLIDGGFARVADNVVVIIAESCQPVDQADRETLWRQIEQAEALPVETIEQREARTEAIGRARKKFAAYQRWSRADGPSQSE